MKKLVIIAIVLVSCIHAKVVDKSLLVNRWWWEGHKVPIMLTNDNRVIFFSCLTEAKYKLENNKIIFTSKELYNDNLRNDTLIIESISENELVLGGKKKTKLHQLKPYDKIFINGDWKLMSGSLMNFDETDRITIDENLIKNDKEKVKEYDCSFDDKYFTINKKKYIYKISYDGMYLQLFKKDETKFDKAECILVRYRDVSCI